MELNKLVNFTSFASKIYCLFLSVCILSYNGLHNVQLGWVFLSFDLSRNRLLPIVSFKVNWNFPPNPLDLLGDLQEIIRFFLLLKDSLRLFQGLSHYTHHL